MVTDTIAAPYFTRNLELKPRLGLLPDRKNIVGPIEPIAVKNMVVPVESAGIQSNIL